MFERILFYHLPTVSLQKIRHAISLALALVFVGVNTFSVACQTCANVGQQKQASMITVYMIDGANGATAASMDRWCACLQCPTRRKAFVHGMMLESSLPSFAP